LLFVCDLLIDLHRKSDHQIQQNVVRKNEPDHEVKARYVRVHVRDLTEHISNVLPVITEEDTEQSNQTHSKVIEV